MELLDPNLQYAHVHLPSEKETTVSVKHLAPQGNIEISTKLSEAPNVIPENTDNIVEELCLPNKLFMEMLLIVVKAHLILHQKALSH